MKRDHVFVYSLHLPTRPQLIYYESMLASVLLPRARCLELCPGLCCISSLSSPPAPFPFTSPHLPPMAPAATSLPVASWELSHDHRRPPPQFFPFLSQGCSFLSL